MNKAEDSKVIQFPASDSTEDQTMKNDAEASKTTDAAEPDKAQAGNDHAGDLPEGFVVSETQMPRTLVARMLKIAGIGAAIIVVSLTLMIMERRAEYLVCTALGIGFILWGLNYRRLFFAGKIEERAMRCVSYTESRIGNRARISFVDANESYHEFVIDKRVEPFVVDATYLLYSKKGQPKELICWQMI